MRYTSFIILGVLLWIAIPTRAEDVSGQVFLPGKGPAREAVIYLEGKKRATPLEKAVVDQREKAFIPHISVVTVGTTIEFPNSDTVFHNVFAYHDAKKFDLGMYPRGASKRQTFSKVGVVALQCNIHSGMSAYIMVVDTPYFAVTDKQGRFVIKNVEPGAYTLRAWHESGPGASQPLTVKAEENVVNVTLTRK